MLRILLLPVLLAVFPFHVSIGPTPTPIPTGLPVASNVPMGTTVTLTINSLVKMGTAGGVLPVGLPVTLHVLRATTNSGTIEPVTQSIALTADKASGPLHFAPFTALVGDVCVVTVSYQGITQGSVPHTVQDGETVFDLPVVLYDQTTDAASIKITETTQTLHFAPGNLIAILETVDWTATGDRFFLTNTKTAAGDPISVQLTLPVGARAVAFSTQPVRRFVIGGSSNMPSIQDTVPVIPGVGHRVVFSYQVPYSQGAYIDRDYPNAVDKLTILVPNDAGVNVTGTSGSTFSAQANTTLDAQRPYTEYRLTAPIKPGGRLVYTLNGSPQVVVESGQVPVTNNGPSLGLILLVSGIVVIVAIISLWLLRLMLLKRAPPR